MTWTKAKAINDFDGRVLKPIYDEQVHCRDINRLWRQYIHVKVSAGVITYHEYDLWKGQPFYLEDMPFDIAGTQTQVKHHILNLFTYQVEAAEGMPLKSMHSVRLENQFYVFKKKLWDLDCISTATYRRYRGWVHPKGPILHQPGILDIGRKLCRLAGHPAGYNPNSLKPWQLNILRRKLGIIKDD